jgi:hypothetical protein
LALSQTNGSAEAAIAWLLDHEPATISKMLSAKRAPLPPCHFEDEPLSPQTISIDILSNSIQLCHFGPIMRYLMKCVAMLDFENSSASVVTSGKHAAAQKYQEFVPELDQWLSIVANPGPSAPVRETPLPQAPISAPPPPPPVVPIERKLRKSVLSNTVLHNHELPVVVSPSSADQPLGSDPAFKPPMRLISTSKSGETSMEWIDLRSALNLLLVSPEHLDYLIDKKTLGNPYRSSAGTMQSCHSTS